MFSEEMIILIDLADGMPVLIEYETGTLNYFEEITKIDNDSYVVSFVDGDEYYPNYDYKEMYIMELQLYLDRQIAHCQMKFLSVTVPTEDMITKVFECNCTIQDLMIKGCKGH